MIRDEYIPLSSKELKRKAFCELKQKGFKRRELREINFPSFRNYREMKVGPNYFIERGSIIFIDYDGRINKEVCFNSYKDFFYDLCDTVITNVVLDMDSKRDKKKYPDSAVYICSVENMLSRRISEEYEAKIVKENEEFYPKDALYKIQDKKVKNKK